MGLSQRRRDRHAHHHHPPDLFRPVRDPYEPRTLRERLVARMVLNGVPDLVGGHGDSGEGFPRELIGHQADSFSRRIIMVAHLGHFHLDVLHVEPIQ